MEEQEPNQTEQAVSWRPPQSSQANNTSFQALTELLDFRHLVSESLLHPVEAFNAYVPLSALDMFGSKSFAVSDIPDLENKVILVTGGNTGLGYESIKALAGHGPAHIYMASRTESKATAAIADIKKINPSANISYLPLDLSSFASIRSAANSFKAQEMRLDILMLNAGIMAGPSGITKEGFEIQFGTNHLGHFLLTKLLLPTLQSTAATPGVDVRIVTLTSEAHNLARSKSPLFSQSELKTCGAWGRYGYSKLANILFAKQLAVRYPEVLSVSVHPGLVATDLYRPSEASNILVKVGMTIGGWVRIGPEQGALGQLWASVAPRGKVVNGAYYKPVGIKSSGSWLAADGKLAEEFWGWSEKEVESKGY